MLDIRSLHVNRRIGNLESLGAVAQLGERPLCKREVGGSIPLGSTQDSQRQSQSALSPHRAP